MNREEILDLRKRSAVLEQKYLKVSKLGQPKPDQDLDVRNEVQKIHNRLCRVEREALGEHVPDKNPALLPKRFAALEKKAGVSLAKK